MNKILKLGVPNLWLAVMAIGFLGCLLGIAYAMFKMKLEAGTLMVLIGAPGVLAVALLGYRGQRRRVEYTEKGGGRDQQRAGEDCRGRPHRAGARGQHDDPRYRQGNQRSTHASAS
ncbi:MAG: hypothetical protein IPG06_04630 [Haliea sp.]|nr:hypothetical protein [Haliea sp.]